MPTTQCTVALAPGVHVRSTEPGLLPVAACKPLATPNAGLGVALGVGTTVGTSVAVGAGVGTGVAAGTGTGVGTGVAVGAGVGTSVAVGAGVGVTVSLPMVKLYRRNTRSSVDRRNSTSPAPATQPARYTYCPLLRL